MKHKLILFTALFFTVTIVCLIGTAGETPKTSDLDTNIQTAAKYLLDRQPDPGKECKDGVYFLVAAVEQSIAKAGYAKEINKKMTVANKHFKKNGVFDKEGLRLLHDIYESINGGKAFQMPPIESIDDAVAQGKKLLDAARKKIKENDYKFAAKAILETTLMTMTPVRK